MNDRVVSWPAVTPRRVLQGQHLGQTRHGQQRDDRRQLVLGDAACGERSRHCLELGGPEPLGVAGDLGPDRLAVVRQRRELHDERGAAGIGVEVPERAQRAVGGHRSFDARHVRLGTAPEDLEEEVVHGAEVVVHELRLEAGLGRDPSRRDGGVALLEEQQLGCVEQLGAALGVLGADAAGRGSGRHARQLATPARRMLSICSVLLCGCTAVTERGRPG